MYILDVTSSKLASFSGHFQQEKWPGNLSKFKLYTAVMSWQLFFFIQAVNIGLVYVIRSSTCSCRKCGLPACLLQFLQQIEVE